MRFLRNSIKVYFVLGQFKFDMSHTRKIRTNLEHLWQRRFPKQPLLLRAMSPANGNRRPEEAIARRWESGWRGVYACLLG